MAGLDGVFSKHCNINSLTLFADIAVEASAVQICDKKRQDPTALSNKKCTLAMMSMGEKSGQFDVVIVGGGPGGMAAALWCDELGLTSCLIDGASNFGGQLHWIHNPITNYLGGKFDNGTAVLRAFSASLSDRRFTQMLDLRMTAIDRTSMTVSLDDGRDISAKAIVIATGIRRRMLGVPGETEFNARGILGSGSRDKSEASGKTVAVIGGGDAALENALILAEYAEKVYLVHRRAEFSARKEFVRAVKHHDRIETIRNARVKEFGGSSQLEFVDLELNGGGSQRISIDNAVVRIGVQPNSEILNGIADLDSAGYVVVDHETRTSVSNIYAIGDVAHPVSPTISTATGSAASAIKSISAFVRKTE